MATIESTHHAVESLGWREGKPVEDPAKTKRWGFVIAKPSEYLIHVRGGRLRERSSGQGATCFKLPWDSVAIVPTSLQRLAFRADQITTEKVGVEVVGLAVYRIVEPRVAFRVLNFSYPERAQQKLEHTLGAMCVGATRRLVANLGVEQCLSKRKSALADELLAEVAPVVGGSGSVEDSTHRGWGIVVDTIEIQEVRVLSGRVFEAMQAPYRAALDREARQARADAERAVALAETAAKQEIDEARRAAEASLREREAQAEIDAHALRTEAQQRRVALARFEREATLEARRAEAEIALVEGRARSEVELAAARAERERLEGRARLAIAEQLPALAAAVGERIGEVKVVQIGGDGNAFGSIAQAVRSVVELAKGA